MFDPPKTDIRSIYDALWDLAVTTDAKTALINYKDESSGMAHSVRFDPKLPNYEGFMQENDRPSALEKYRSATDTLRLAMNEEDQRRRDLLEQSRASLRDSLLRMPIRQPTTPLLESDSARFISDRLHKARRNLSISSGVAALWYIASSQSKNVSLSLPFVSMTDTPSYIGTIALAAILSYSIVGFAIEVFELWDKSSFQRWSVKQFFSGLSAETLKIERLLEWEPLAEDSELTSRLKTELSSEKKRLKKAYRFAHHVHTGWNVVFPSVAALLAVLFLAYSLVEN